MRAIVLGGVFVLAGCASAPRPVPAQIGMTYEEYASGCTIGTPIVQEWGPETVGECPGQPREYVILEKGKVVSVLHSDTFKQNLQRANCAADTSCINRIDRMFAEREQKKQRYLEAQNSRAASSFFETLGRVGNAMQSVPASTADDGGMPSGPQCFFRSEYTSGQNKICNYDCNGSITPKVQPAISICMPMASP